MEIGNKHHASCIGKTAFLHNKHFVSLSLISTPRVKKNNPRVNQEQSLLPMLIPAQFTATHLLPLLTASPAMAMVACRFLPPLPEGSDNPASAAACHAQCWWTEGFKETFWWRLGVTGGRKHGVGAAASCAEGQRPSTQQNPPQLVPPNASLVIPERLSKPIQSSTFSWKGDDSQSAHFPLPDVIPKMP